MDKEQKANLRYGFIDWSESDHIMKIHSKEKVDCTFCRYCMNKCPKNIAIPDYFKLLNRISQFGEGQLSMARKSYIRRTQTFGKASDCICCGQCEECCPQHLPITKHLIEIAKMLDN